MAYPILKASRREDHMDLPAKGTQMSRKALLGVIALLFSVTALNYLDRQVLSLLKPTLQGEFHWNDTQFAWLGTASQVAAIAALFVVGWFVDRFGVRFAFALAVAVWSLAGMGHAAATTVGGFMIARVVLIFAETINTPAAMKAAALYVPLEQRSIAIGVVNTASNIGAIVAPLIIPLMAVNFGWHATFLVTGGLGFLWIAFWLSGTRSLTPTPAAAASIAKEGKVDWAAILTDRRTWAIAIAKFLTDSVWWFLLFWTPDLFSKVFKLSQAEVGYPTALVYTMAAFGSLSSGFLFPKLLKNGFSVNRARKTSMFLFACLILPITLALSANSPWSAAVIIGLALFAHQGFSTNIFGMTTDIVPAARVGTVIAVGAIFGNLGGVLTNMCTGYALDNGLGYWPLFAFASSAYLLALLAIHLLLPVIQSNEAG
jgi:MFS transporter, ACS family, hexuronate transporter